MKINVIASEGFLFPDLCYNRNIHIKDHDIYVIPKDIEPHTIYFNSHDICELDYAHRYILKDDSTDIIMVCLLRHRMTPLVEFFKEFDNVTEAEDWFINNSREEISLRLHGKFI